MTPKAKIWGGSLTIVGAVATALGAWLTTGQTPGMGELGGVIVVLLGAGKVIYDSVKASE